MIGDPLIEIGIIVAVFALALFSGFKLKSVSFRGKKLIEVEQAGEVSKKLTPHQSCPHSPEVAIAMKAQRVLIEKNVKAFTVDLLSEQMILVENTIEIIMAHMREVFLKLLKTKKGEKNGLIASMEYDHYQKILHIIRFEANKLCKRYLKENHLSQKTEAEFEVYIRLRTKAIMAFVTEFLNREYAIKTPSREELYDANQAIAAETADMIESAIRQCRQISMAYEKEGGENERKIADAFGPFIMER